jgi:hypothetical protein
MHTLGTREQAGIPLELAIGRERHPERIELGRGRIGCDACIHGENPFQCGGLYATSTTPIAGRLIRKFNTCAILAESLVNTV